MHPPRPDDTRPALSSAQPAAPTSATSAPGATASSQRVADFAHLTEPPLIAGRRFGGWPGLIGVLVGGLKALAMLPVRPGAIPARAIWTLVLGLAIITIAIVGDAMLLGEASDDGATLYFNWQTLRASGLDFAIVLFASVWLAEPRRRGFVTRPLAPPGTDDPAALPRSTPPPTLAGREPPPPLYFATVVLAASFWTVLASYLVTIGADRALRAGGDPWFPGMGFYTLMMFWPWWVALRAIQYLNRYQPIPWWRRAIVIIVMLASIIGAVIDPGDPFWLYGEPDEPEVLYTASLAFDGGAG